jgi:AcrR family transcriptional regulator
LRGLTEGGAGDPLYLVGVSAGDPATKRAYKMEARARATEATRVSILDATETAFEELSFDEITLASIAARAGVSVQTVLRHFETRDKLLMASLLHAGSKIPPDRQAVPVGDLDEIVNVLVHHYEQFGDRILRLLAEEDREPAARQLTDLGRAFHREWCMQAFAPVLEGLRGATHERRIAQFVAATDIYVWTVLRRDQGLSRRQAKLAIRELVEPLTKASR